MSRAGLIYLRYNLRENLKASVRFELPTFEYVPYGPDFAGRWFLPTCAKTTALTA